MFHTEAAVERILRDESAPPTNRQLLQQLGSALRADATSGGKQSYDIGSFLDIAEVIDAALAR